MLGDHVYRCKRRISPGWRLAHPRAVRIVREYPPPWAHAVHVARASEKKGAPCSCGSWRGVRAWPVVSVLYLPENASENIARCGVKNLPVLFSNSRVCVCAFARTTAFAFCVCVFVLATGKIKDSAATAGPNSWHQSDG